MLREIRKLFPDVLNFSVLNICNIMYILVEWEGFFAHQKSEIRIFRKKFWLHNIHLIFSTYPHEYILIVFTENLF